VSVSGPAPFDADGLDWFAGWSPGIAAENRAAAAGRAALEAHWAGAEPEDMDAFFTKATLLLPTAAVLVTYAVQRRSEGRGNLLRRWLDRSSRPRRHLGIPAPRCRQRFGGRP
jgi:hypothetical protein